MFKDRYDAAKQLAEKLNKYKNENGVVLAVPRGGVPLGYIVAKDLGFPLEIVLSKKIGHPYNSEYAIGAATSYGAIINENIKDVDPNYIRNETIRLQKELEVKFKLFMGEQKPVDLENKTVIVVDDGIATGYTLLATIQSIKQSKPRKIIIAVPVAPPSSVSKFKDQVDEFICLLIPEDFQGVGQFYLDFSQVSDDEVIRLLRDINKEKKGAG